MKESRDKNRLKAFGLHIRNLRKKLDLSQDEVAARCDVTKGNLSMIENGNKDLLLSTLFELSKGFNLPPKELLDFKINLQNEELL